MITIHSPNRKLTVYPDGIKYPQYHQTIHSNLDKDTFSNPVARDLIRIGQAIYTADRTVRRKSYVGGQTRDIQVKIDLENQMLFNAAMRELINLAGFCTRDNWDFKFGSIKPKVKSRVKTSDKNLEKFDCVALFSDGLDSLCGAARLIKSGSIPLFVSHFQPRWGYSTMINRLCEISSALGRKDHNCASISIRFELSDKGEEGRHNYFPEYTRRSRPCLYLCYAAAVAVEYNIEKILLHENGILAMNLPYSKSHFGSQISRHAHPVTLHRMQNFLSSVWPNKTNSPVLENPFFKLTKDDQVSQFCKHLPQDLVESTNSCENSSRALLSYKGRLKNENSVNKSDFTHCGVCTPCLIRRQAMLANDNSEEYNYAFAWKGPEKGKVILLQNFVNDNFQILEKHCRELLKKSKTDFILQYFTELTVLSECFDDLEGVIIDIYELQKRFASQYLKTIESL
jgi:7-cyano-7-deazaguanine synthase in queuosine biosynthesis